MNVANERKLAARATELGNSADAGALRELVELTRSASPLVRRRAASGLGKLAGIVCAKTAVKTLQPLLSDSHPQVRQYAAKALGAYGTHAGCALEDLRDLYRNPAEKDYVKRSVAAAGKTIREALEIAEKKKVRSCRRCGARVSADEYARSRKAFQRMFCDKCFDEVYLDRRNFDTKVELNKRIRAADGTFVQSKGERKIADFLNRHGIAYRYDERMRIIEGYAIRPDFYLPEFDFYIEYWGMDTTDYKIGMLKKRTLYQQQGKKLVSMYRREYPHVEDVLLRKLGKYVRLEKR